MMDDSQHTDLLIALAVAFQVAALMLLRNHRFAFFVAQFGAAHLVTDAARIAGRPELLLVGRLLLIPLIACVFFRAARSRWAPRLALLALFAVSGAFFGAAWERSQDQELAPRPVVALDNWDPAYPLRLHHTSAQLRPLVAERPRARLLSQSGEVRLDWLPHGGAQEVVAEFENAGALSDYSVEEGDVEILQRRGSTLALRCRFGQRGGACRVRIADARDKPVRVLVVAGAAGDLDALGRLLDAGFDRGVDVVIGLGDLVVLGDYPGLLAVRDLIDSYGVRSIVIPGEGERGQHGLRAFRSVFGPGTGVARQGRLAGVLFDTSERDLHPRDIKGVGILAKFAATTGLPVILSHRPVFGGDSTIPRDVRSKIAEDLKFWTSSSLLLTAGKDQVNDLREDGLRQISVGAGAGRLAACWFRVDGDVVGDLFRLSVPRRDRLPEKLRTRWLLLAATAREHWELGERLALSLSMTVGTLILFVLSLVMRSRHE